MMFLASTAGFVDLREESIAETFILVGFGVLCSCHVLLFVLSLIGFKQQEDLNDGAHATEIQLSPTNVTSKSKPEDDV
jgi:hypothetical protein